MNRQSKIIGLLALLAVCSGVLSALSEEAGGVDEVFALRARGRGRGERIDRRGISDGLRRVMGERRRAAVEWARRRQRPVRVEGADGGVVELVGLDGEQPLYLQTLNATAATSTAANVVWDAPYMVDGSGSIVGVWDAASVRVTHQEFGGRATVADGSVNTHEHATHVAGTVGAVGVESKAKGMAPGVEILSYDWDDDLAEMADEAASYPQEGGKILLSNHSYGFTAGWYRTGGTPKWGWVGSGTNAAAYSQYFGQYHSEVRKIDLLAHAYPYYLIVQAAGNDRGENPVVGDSIELNETPASYNKALHPPGDGVYKNGYDTIILNGVAKNVLTVGAVADAVDGGVRSPVKGTMSSFSSWGPTDDGRIKPDVVANGVGLYSATDAGNTSYGNMSGTSMATPNVSGSAVLLTALFGQLFDNTAMRAATLKGLLIHTADDLGSPGPDYKFGWGLVNVGAAAELIAGYYSDPTSNALVEDRVSTTRKVVEVPFVWDGISAIKATLSWSDPAGSSTNKHDNRSKRLVNNLDLRIVAPGGAVHEPWVMPYVGSWSSNNFDAVAVSGSNTTDNVEQVVIGTPVVSGVYTARVSYAGALSGGEQPFALLISGSVGSEAARRELVVESATPDYGSGTVMMSVAGNNFMLGVDIRLVRFGRVPVKGRSVEIQGDTAVVLFDATGMSDGWWHLAVTNPDGSQAGLPHAFMVGELPDEGGTVILIY